jgi:hypothetical protein
MRNDSEAHEVRATVIGSGRHEARAAYDQTQPSDIVDAEVIDPHAVIIDEGPAAPVSAAQDRDPVGASSAWAQSGVRGNTPGAPAGMPRSTTADDADELTGGMAADDADELTGTTAADDADELTGTTADADDGRPDTVDDLAPQAADDEPADRADGPPEDTGTDLAGDTELMHERWAAIQSSFVDDPRASVAAAADLVGEAISTLMASAKERERGMRSEWDRDGVDTEGLRHALRSYRGFLDRIVAL